MVKVSNDIDLYFPIITIVGSGNLYGRTKHINFNESVEYTGNELVNLTIDNMDTHLIFDNMFFRAKMICTYFF